MVTTVTTKTGRRTATRPSRGVGLEGSGKRTGGNGSRGNFPPNGGGGSHPRDDTPHHYRIGMWIAVASILMLFMALTSAYVFRAAVGGWQTLQTPRWLWVSTALIVASSFTFHRARVAVKREEESSYRGWLAATAALGSAFLASQLLAWRELVAQGVYLVSNPHSSFFYLLTALHGLHLAGGIVGLLILIARSKRKAGDARGEGTFKVRRRAAAEAVGIYWHFMDGLWVYLFVLLFLWR